MAKLGKYSGDPNQPYSYIQGKHWENDFGYIVYEGESGYNHFFGDETWTLPMCKNCKGRFQQIFTLNLSDPRLSSISKDLPELPLVSCMNCAICWEPVVYKLNTTNKSIEIISFTNNSWMMDDELKLPAPLPQCNIKLERMSDKDIPTSEELYEKLTDHFGTDSVCRLLGAPLFLQNPIDLECPCCKEEMLYIATICEQSYAVEKPLLGNFTFHFGEMWLYFFYCDKCKIVKSETQST